MRAKELVSVIDHTALGPAVPKARIKNLCREASKYGFYAVCVSPYYVQLVSDELEDTPVKICTTVGFPHGAHSPQAKLFEAKQAVDDGADELDMVINIAALKEGDYKTVLEEIRSIREETKRKGTKETVLKVILENSLLKEDEKVSGCILAKAAGADFVKTATGFGPGGATVGDVRLMRQTVGEKIGVKAAGGIKTYQECMEFIEAGANRIGSSSSVDIMEGAPDRI